ncbi:thioesterase family protein [Streptomyces sp. NPDC001388]|uniref:thioesterase family protein n=1 Tax=Streptomyces sp. NPDC001388 TaxID=3364568 RepID=UPI0036C5DCE5
MSPRTFAQATAVTQTGQETFTADLDPLWTVVGKPGGGCLQAIAGRAAGHAAGVVAPHPHLVSATSSFIRTPRPDKVSVTTEVLRVGRTTTHVRTRISQEDEPCVETLAVFATLTSEPASRTWLPGNQPPPGRPYAECARFQPPKDVFPVDLLDQIEVRIEPDSLGFATGEPRGLGEVRGWLDLPGTPAFDPLALLLAADVLPPATFDIQLTGWVPTISLSTYVRALPAPGPVHITLHANAVAHGRVDETCTIRDSTGRLVAQSHQLAAIRLT